MTSQQPHLQFDQVTLDKWVDTFQQHNQSYEGFVKALVREVLALKETNKRLDIENKNLLTDRQRFEKQWKLLDSDLNKNKFVGVLIDGDGMLTYLAQGSEGGRHATHELITSTRDHLKDVISPTTKVWIFVFANVPGLALSLAQRNVVNANTFHEFINGFNSVDDLVTFANVGRGKELVDTKIKAMMEMFASWPQCQNIILGGSHDNGYARTLLKLETDQIMPGKVRLLQGPPFAAELAQLSTSYFPRVEFGDLFMTSKLESERANSYSQVAMDGVLKFSPKPSPAVTAGATPNISESHKGLPDKAVYLSLKQLKPAPYNNHYLNRCYKQESDCKYSHSHKLSEAQVAALGYYCKRNPCDSWQQTGSCQFGDNCLRGHDCPDAIKGKCTKSDCRLVHPQQGTYI